MLALHSARPGAVVRPWLLAVPVAAALSLFAARLVQAPVGQILPAVLGNSAACLVSITALSAPAIILDLALFRRGATLRPAPTGALIGLAASGGAAAGYALHCTEDSPLFSTVWYGLAMLAGITAGAAAGRRMLRWYGPQAVCYRAHFGRSSALCPSRGCHRNGRPRDEQVVDHPVEWLHRRGAAPGATPPLNCE